MGGRSARLTVATVILMVALTLPANAQSGQEDGQAKELFQQTWARTDKPVADEHIVRTWMWGPGPLTGTLLEPYAESPDGRRSVQYFDKSRMEINDPDAINDGLWYVTNGLLVVEMVEGYFQTGDAAFDDSPEPADINIAGDPGERPTYADIHRLQLRSQPAARSGTFITATYGEDNTIGEDAAYAGYSVRAARYVPETQHSIAAPFWDFMTKSGIVWDNSDYVIDRYFQSPYYPTGYPITEAYWSRIKVAGTKRDVLWQCFERRCLTYTPDHPAAWQVEAANDGLHYYQWRHGPLSSAPASVEARSLESDTVIHWFLERGSLKLKHDIAVDITQPGIYDEETDLPAQQPVILKDRAVASYYVHADQTNVAGSVVLYATITFPKLIIGIIVRDETLVASHDLLGAPATVYPGEGEINFELNSPCAESKQDCLTLSDDRRTLILKTTIYDLVDQIRVITEPAWEPTTRLIRMR
jgi:hypothetical protein